MPTVSQSGSNNPLMLATLPPAPPAEKPEADQSPEDHSNGHEGYVRNQPAPAFRISPADIKLYNAQGIPILRAEHPVRDCLEVMIQALSEFADSSLRPRSEFGFRQTRSDPIDVKDLTAKVAAGKQFLEAHSMERSDGLGPSIMIRNVAGEGAEALEHFLVDMITSYPRSGPSEGDIPELLHRIAGLKGTFRKFIQHFDTQMVSIAGQGGLFEALNAKSGEEAEQGDESDNETEH